jgi:hypothetical protein
MKAAGFGFSAVEAVQRREADMMTALLETIGALGVLASIAAKFSLFGWGRGGRRKAGLPRR